MVQRSWCPWQGLAGRLWALCQLPHLPNLFSPLQDLKAHGPSVPVTQTHDLDLPPGHNSTTLGITQGGGRALAPSPSRQTFFSSVRTPASGLGGDWVDVTKAPSVAVRSSSVGLTEPASRGLGSSRTQGCESGDSAEGRCRETVPVYATASASHGECRRCAPDPAPPSACAVCPASVRAGLPPDSPDLRDSEVSSVRPSMPVTLVAFDVVVTRRIGQAMPKKPQEVPGARAVAAAAPCPPRRSRVWGAHARCSGCPKAWGA